MSNLSIPTYPWTVLSDNYGSIFPERQWIIGELLVSLGDTVKKWQRVAIINAPTNTPEMVSMVAWQRAEIAIAQWELQSAKEKLIYINDVVASPNSSFRQAYDVQRKALDIQYEVQKKQLDAKIASLRANLEARWVVIESSRQASSATIAENTQKGLWTGIEDRSPDMLYALSSTDLMCSYDILYDYDSVMEGMIKSVGV
jgi:multidrug efflux pump subunit AcrA (membrane-fusion protein)